MWTDIFGTDDTPGDFIHILFHKYLKTLWEMNLVKIVLANTGFYKQPVKVNKKLVPAKSRKFLFKNLPLQKNQL